MSGAYVEPGCYGKLPFWPEYLSENLAGASAREVKRWLHEGRAAAGLSADGGSVEEPNETRSLRFLYGAPGASDLAVGVVRPSADVGGKRRFPFAVLVTLPRRASGRNWELLPMALSPVWDALDDFWDALAAVASRAAFDQVFSSARVPAPAAPGDLKGEFDAAQRESVARIFDRGDGASLPALRVHLPDALREIKKDPGGARLDVPASRPLELAAFEASFWMELVNRQFFWKRLEPQVFLDSGARARDRRIAIVSGRIEPEDYGWILGTGAPGPRVKRPADLPAPAGENPGGEAAPSFADLVSGGAMAHPS